MTSEEQSSSAKIYSKSTDVHSMYSYTEVQTLVPGGLTHSPLNENSRAKPQHIIFIEVKQDAKYAHPRFNHTPYAAM